MYAHLQIMSSEARLQKFFYFSVKRAPDHSLRLQLCEGGGPPGPPGSATKEIPIGQFGSLAREEFNTKCALFFKSSKWTKI